MALEVQQQEQQHRATTSTSCRSKTPFDNQGGDFLYPSSAVAALHRAIPTTLDLFHSKLASSPIELDEPLPLPFGWQKCLDLKTGAIYYTKEAAEMSSNGKNAKLDLKLNLSPPQWASHQIMESPNSSSSSISSPSSCMSSELNLGSEAEMAKYPSSPEETTSMVLVGCPRCLMYVMLSEEDPKCPKCKSTVLLDFHRGNSSNRNNSNNNSNKIRKN
ncbi:protein GL2-INTERACTING REPRESSOR 1-like [Magnolia sinica]|uniref:protein GL2-INTERACTING REPRESSOR 1-like n=1 Tax=Magnolia sinica TaxID=86752 RepID=UPI00265B5851|nr:protein GL2-INTERACTING REPRESSOR 1-like [Magnolia sinica]